MKKNVLVIDCENEIFDAVKCSLEDETTGVYHADTLEAGLQMLTHNQYSLVILDVFLSDHSGSEVIRALRNINPMPILVLSEHAGTAERIQAIQNGADDCMEKTDDYEECLVRAGALLRRYTELNHIAQHGYAVVSHDELVLDTANRSVFIKDDEVALSPKEYGILLYLVKNRSRTMSFEQIYSAVWKQPFMGDNDALNFHVRNLRKKLGSPDWIESVYGVGYRIKGLGLREIG